MQFGKRTPVPGIVYNTTLQRPDAALALAMLQSMENKREAKVASIAVNENGLAAAAFADAVFRFYQLGPVPNANRTLPIGLAADKALPPDSEPLKALAGKYPTKMKRVSDTAEPSALMRNSLAYVDDGWVTVISSAPATYLARILDYNGAADLIKAKVKNTIFVDGPQDPAAMQRLLAAWPAPIQFLPADEALLYPGTGLEKDFAWTKAHPAADFYQAAHAMPYDAPALDPTAVLWAVRPGSGLFQTTKGTLSVTPAGKLQFTPSPDGKHERIEAIGEKRAQVIESVRTVLATKPEPPPARRRFTAEEIEALQKQREAEQLKRAEEERKAAAAQKK